MKFTGKWNPPYPEEAGPVQYYSKLNGKDADIFYSYQGPYPSKFKGCLAFVGGFTDCYFFDKEKIENLSVEDQKEFEKYIKTV
jgi:hypothetical protein